jgi:PhnB protein
MGSDVPPDSYEKPKGFAVSVTLNKEADGQRIFKTLAERGTVTMPFQPTFWSPGFGMLVDRFGIPWIVNTASQDS